MSWIIIRRRWNCITRERGKSSSYISMILSLFSCDPNPVFTRACVLSVSPSLISLHSKSRRKSFLLRVYFLAHSVKWSWVKRGKRRRARFSLCHKEHWRQLHSARRGKRKSETMFVFHLSSSYFPIDDGCAELESCGDADSALSYLEIDKGRLWEKGDSNTFFVNVIRDYCMKWGW